LNVGDEVDLVGQQELLHVVAFGEAYLEALVVLLQFSLHDQVLGLEGDRAFDLLVLDGLLELAEGHLLVASRTVEEVLDEERQ
jgi:hypothetical protein